MARGTGKSKSKGKDDVGEVEKGAGGGGGGGSGGDEGVAGKSTSAGSGEADLEVVLSKMGDAMNVLTKIREEQAREIQANHDETRRRENALVLERVAALVKSTKQTVAAQLDKVVEDVEGMLASSKEAAAASKDAAKMGLEGRKLLVFSEKVFRGHSSLLTNMLKAKDFQTIYNIFAAVLVWLGVLVVVQEYNDTGNLINFSLAWWAFSMSDIVIPVWAGMFSMSFLVVAIVQAIHVYKLPQKYGFLIYGLLQLAFMLLPSYMCLRHQIPIASGFIIMCEEVRMMMKMHAYMREKLLYGTKNSYSEFIPKYARDAGVELKHLNRPTITIVDLQTELGRYMYFHFTPTLVYRDEYPQMGESVRWIEAFKHLLNFLGSTLFTFVIFRGLCVPFLEETALKQTNTYTFVASIYRCMMPAMLIFLLMFFGILHSWFNLWSELLRFSDKRFYQDWWNAKTWGSYYRKWNAVVHEWLYYYIYLDTQRFSRGKVSKTVARYIVFIVSAIMHEWIIAFGSGFFYPILLLLFGGPGVFFVSLTRRAGRFNNVFMWLMLSIGNALILILYAREFYARFANALPFDTSEYDNGLWRAYPRSWLVWSKMELN